MDVEGVTAEFLQLVATLETRNDKELHASPRN